VKLLGIGAEVGRRSCAAQSEWIYLLLPTLLFSLCIFPCVSEFAHAMSLALRTEPPKRGILNEVRRWEPKGHVHAKTTDHRNAL